TSWCSATWGRTRWRRGCQARAGGCNGSSRRRATASCRCPLSSDRGRPDKRAPEGLPLPGEVAGRQLIPVAVRLECGLVLGADTGRAGDGAPGVEATARGRVDRGWDLALEQDRHPGPLGDGIGNRDRAEERFGIGVLVMLIDVGPVRDLNDLAE